MKNSIEYFSKSIKNNPLLTREEEIKLSKLAKQGNKEARKKLIESNFRLVFSIAKKYHKQGVSFDDLVQENELEIFHGKEYLKIINVKPNSLITVYSDDFMEIKEISINNNKQSIFKKQSVDSVAYHKPNNVNTDYLQKNIGRELIISEPIINFLNTKHAILNNGNNFVQLNNTIPGGGNTNFSMMDSFTLRHMNNLYLFESNYHC